MVIGLKANSEKHWDSFVSHCVYHRQVITQLNHGIYFITMAIFACDLYLISGWDVSN
jgi:hypothetical protein